MFCGGTLVSISMREVRCHNIYPWAIPVIMHGKLLTSTVVINGLHMLKHALYCYISKYYSVHLIQSESHYQLLNPFFLSFSFAIQGYDVVIRTIPA